jgi:hypothetical protein
MSSTKKAATAIALGWFTTCVLQPQLAFAQQQMSAEDAAIYKEMVKRAGVNPDPMNDARKANESALTWASAKVVHYHIVGTYQGTPNISSEPGKGSGFADVTDRVVIELDWKLGEAKLAGVPTFENTKSVVTNPHDSEPSCLPPVLKGEYQHFELLGVKDGLGGALEMQVQSVYPAVEVVQFCTGNRKSIAVAVKTRLEELIVPSPVMLTMPLPDSDALRISPDKKSLVVKKAGWTWTYTPSIKK